MTAKKRVLIAYDPDETRVELVKTNAQSWTDMEDQARDLGYRAELGKNGGSVAMAFLLGVDNATKDSAANPNYIFWELLSEIQHRLRFGTWR